MLVTIGSVREQVKLKDLQAKWRQKKQDTGGLTGSGRENEVVIGQHRMPGHDYRRSEVETRLNCGKPLSASDMEYLRKNYPETYARACRVKSEREAYERELRRCKSKDEVRFLRMSRTADFAGDIRTAAKSGEAMSETHQKSMADADEHNKFLREKAYSRLPESRRGRRFGPNGIVIVPVRLPGEIVVYDKNAKKRAMAAKPVQKAADRKK